MKTVLQSLESLSDSRRESILRFHNDHLRLAMIAKGSAEKHQAWPGGYLDHLAETFRIAEANFAALSGIRALPFELDSALICLYFHDIEKLWKYSEGLPENFDKDDVLFHKLREQYGIQFSEEEANALVYMHGESDATYSPTVRVMNALASFCHCADNISARLWPQEGRGLG